MNTTTDNPFELDESQADLDMEDSPTMASAALTPGDLEASSADHSADASGPAQAADFFQQIAILGVVTSCF